MAEEESLVAGRSNSQRKEDALKRKQLWLAAYEEHGTIKKACEIAGIARKTYKNWSSSDLDFAKEVDERRQSFAESLEEIALERVRNPDRNRGSDVLLIGLLNANMPHKYRPQTVDSDRDAAKDLILEWRKAASIMKAQMPQQDTDDESELSPPVERVLHEVLEKRAKVVQTEKDEEEKIEE